MIKKTEELIERDKKAIEDIEKERTKLVEETRKELYVIKFLENVLLFEPSNELLFSEGVYLDKDTIRKIISAYKATDYIVNHYLSNPKGIDKYVIDGFRMVGIGVPDDVEDHSHDVDDISTLEKALSSLKEAKGRLEGLSDAAKERIKANVSGFEQYVDSFELMAKDLMIPSKNALIEEVRKALSGITSPVKRDYTMLYRMLIEADPSEVKGFIDYGLRSKALRGLIGSTNGYIDSPEFKAYIKSLNPLLSEAPDEAINIVVSELKDYIKKHEGLGIETLVKFLELTV